MGGGSWNSSAWKSHASTNGIKRGASASSIFSSKAKAEYLPYNVMRESCNSTEHPKSTPIILGLDVTGSMSDLLSEMAIELGNVMKEIYDRKPVTDPQILFAAIDDFQSSGDKCLQVTQFESDIRIAEQMKELEFISRGAGNNHESYQMAWYFAARHTKCDAIKDGRKGVLITYGDDGLTEGYSNSARIKIRKDEVKNVFGDNLKEDISLADMLEELQKGWEVFHITMTRGHEDSYRQEIDDWDRMLGDHHIKCSDTSKISEVTVSLLEAIAGKDIDAIASSWNGDTAIVVREALKGLAVSKKTDTGLVEF